MYRAGRFLRVLVSLAAVAHIGSSACSSFDDYGLRQGNDASSPGTDGAQAGAGGAASGGAAATGGAEAGSGETGSGGVAGSAGLPIVEAGVGGTSPRDSGTDGRKRDGDADASIDSGESVDSHIPAIDIVDGALLRPLPAVSPCGTHVGTVDGGTSLVVDFSCPTIMQDFKFLTPSIVYVLGDWQYDATGDPHLVQLADAQAFSFRGVQGTLAGTRALYMPVIVRDGFVSVHEWSIDDDAACVITRYQDEVNYYRLCLSYTRTAGHSVANVFFIRITFNQASVLGTYKFDDPGHDYPGHVIGLEAVGQSFRAFIDGTRVFVVEDPGGYTFGRVGIEDILLQPGHFDDLTIVNY